MAAQNEATGAPATTGSAPAHLTLGLLAEPEGLGVKAIVAQGVSTGAGARGRGAVLPPAVDDVPALIPYDASAKKALELTFREALRLGHNYVGTEHVLLALLENEDGDGPLTALGVDKAAAEENVAAALADPLVVDGPRARPSGA